MSKQIDDILEFNNTQFIICNSGYANLVQSSDIGMEVKNCGGSLHRGLCATYTIEDSQLILNKLSLCSVDDYVPINGQYPSPDNFHRNMRHYRNLRLPLKSNRKLYVASGSLSCSVFPLISYKMIKGLHIKNGKLVEEIDYSHTARWLRPLIFMKRKLLGENLRRDYDTISKHIPLGDYGYDDVMKRVLG